MKGIYTAIITPFDDFGDIHFKKLHTLIDRQIDAGVSGIVVNGTTAESPTLLSTEVFQLIEWTQEKLKDTSLSIIVGTGTNSTQTTIENSQRVDRMGVDGLLIVTPYYNKPNATGLYSHFETAARSIKSPVILYQIPGRSIVSIPPEMVARLSLIPNIEVIKDATGNMNYFNKLKIELKKMNSSLNFLSGDDGSFIDFLKNGGDGAISAFANVCPHELVQIQNAFNKNKIDKAEEIFQSIQPLMNACFLETNPIGIKYALGCPKVRLPLGPLDKKNQNIIDQYIKKDLFL